MGKEGDITATAAVAAKKDLRDVSARRVVVVPSRMMGKIGALEQVVNADVERDRAVAITAESRVLNFAMVMVVSLSG